jgi:hypothetical protein
MVYSLKIFDFCKNTNTYFTDLSLLQLEFNKNLLVKLNYRAAGEKSRTVPSVFNFQLCKKTAAGKYVVEIAINSAATEILTFKLIKILNESKSLKAPYHTASKWIFSEIDLDDEIIANSKLVVFNDSM